MMSFVYIGNHSINVSIIKEIYGQTVHHIVKRPKEKQCFCFHKYLENEAEEAVKVGGLKDWSIALVACEAHFHGSGGIPSRKFAKIGAVRLNLVLILCKLINYCLKILILHDPLKCILHALHDLTLCDQVVMSQRVIVGGAQPPLSESWGGSSPHLTLPLKCCTVDHICSIF